MKTDPDKKDIQGVYDHHKKAGNEGDVVKHVALIAALDVVLEEWLNRFPRYEPFKFKYADTFAGYAYNPLVPGNGWEDGIKKFHDIFRQHPPDNKTHVARWNNWYVSARPQLLGGVYPGSSLIAADLCAEKNVSVRISLWDTCPKVIQNLESVFGGQGHAIHHRAASISEEEVDSADFLFIDPPDNKWTEIREFVQKGQSALLWLPVCVNTQSKPPPESKRSVQAREEARKEGCSVTKVRWKKGGRGMVGCQLIYRMSKDAIVALRDAVECVVRAAGERWSFEHFDPNTPVS
jgi:23S rRNA A2030 N6-methylase RlmJ